jgi:hypothetical protein
MKKFFSKIAGVSKENDDGTSRQAAIKKFCKPGTTLQLIREPKNKYDKNAIGVWVHGKTFLFGEHEYQTGYISAEVAVELAPLIDSGKVVTAQVGSVSGGTADHPTYGLNIEIQQE